MKPSSSAPPSSRSTRAVSAPQKTMMASATQWLCNIREHFELHCNDLPVEARHTTLLVGSWLLFRALEAHVRDRVLDDYLRKHCRCRRWLSLIFASRYPYLTEMGRLVCPVPGARPVSQPLSERSGRPAEDASGGGSVRAPSRGESHGQAGWQSLSFGADTEPSVQSRARMARIGTEALRRYILVPEARKSPRSNPVGPLSDRDLRTCEDVLNIEDAWAMSGIGSKDAVASYLAEQFVTQLDVDMEDASSVCGGTGTRNSPQAEPPASRELHLEPKTHSAPPSTIQTPQSRLRDMPTAKTTSKRHKIDQPSDGARKRRRTTEGASWTSSPSEEAEASEVEPDEPWSSDAESEEALASPQRPLWAGTPSGGLLRLRDLRDLWRYGHDSFDDVSAASSPQAPPSGEKEKRPPSPRNAPSRVHDQSATSMIRRARSQAPSPELSPPSPPSPPTSPSPPPLPDSMPQPPSPSSPSSFPFPPLSSSSSSPLPSSPSLLPLDGHEVTRRLPLVTEPGDLDSSPCDKTVRPVPAASMMGRTMGPPWGMRAVMSWMRSRGFCLMGVEMASEPLELEIMGPDER